MKRIATILAPEDLGAAGTKVIDINLLDQISRIEMRWRCTNVTVSVMLDAVLACIPKVELVDGGEVLASLSGLELQAANFYGRRVMPYNAISLTVGGYFESVFGLDFGRWLWDPEYALDPKQYNNPQLRITWDEDACNTAVTVNAFAVYGYVDDAPSGARKGFLSLQEISNKAFGTSTHSYVDLPVDAPIRRVLLRAYSTDHDPVTCLSNVKLDVDNGKAVPLDLTAYDLDKILSEYPEIVEAYTLDGAVTAKTLFATVSAHPFIAVDYDATPFVTAQSKFAAPTWTGAKCALAASVDIKALTAIVRGRAPHNVIPIDFGDPKDPASWFVPNPSGSARLDITSSSDADGGDSEMVVVEKVKA